MLTPTLMQCMHDADDGGAQGGHAWVYRLPDQTPAQLELAAQALLAAADSPVNSAQHVSVFVAGHQGTLTAEAYDPHGQRIQFCGHGALAAARVLLDEAAEPDTVLQFRNQQRTWQAARATAAADEIALIYAAPRPLACAVPAFAAKCLGAAPVAAATVGADSDYWVLELPDALAVQGLQPDFECIAAATRRALIVTAKTAAGCVFRYFAPQYGNPEDAATGSAAVQLAAYWAPQFVSQPFKARQLSVTTACMQLTCAGDKVELAARVRYG